MAAMIRRRIPPWAAIFPLLALICPLWGTAQRRTTPPPSVVRPRLEEPDPVWVRTTLKKLSLRDKVAQLVAVRITGRFLNRSSQEYQALIHEVRGSHVGALVLFAGNIYESAAILNDMQSAAATPLLVAADFERGAAMRISDSTSFPWTMAIGATGSEEFAYKQGAITARESRALGVHWIYAPVLDVNNNPDNPVINIRSFGEDPRLVARLGTAFIKGAREGGVLTTAKHFPGHGDTSTDSHIGLGVVVADRPRLDALELIPFRSAIQAGVDSVMTAHLAVPAITGEPNVPATLSPKILTGLLRDELGFKGLIVTDAMEMGGITTRYWTGLAAIRALQAGADMVLLPPDTDVAINEIVRAVRRGDLTESRIDASVERILEAKTRVQLHKRRTVPLGQIASEIATPENQALAQTMADRSITLLKNERDLLPMNPVRPTRIFSLVISADPEPSPGAGFQSELRRRFPGTRTSAIDTRITQENLDAIDRNVGQAEIIICATIVRTISGKGSIGLPENQRAVIEKMLASGKPVVWIAFGNPYVLRAYPQISAYLCTFSYSDVSMTAAAKAIAGELEITGKLPVSIPGYYRAGDGLRVAKLDMTLKEATPEQAGLPAGAFEETRQILSSFVDKKAYPGAALAVGYRGRIVLQASAGRLTYDASGPAVTVDTIFDLASLSKAISTTSAVMMLVEAGKLLLNTPAQDYLPEFQGANKETIRVQDLLTHTAGLPAFLTLYKDTQGYDRVLQKIYATPLQYEPGTQSIYSDLGMILLGEIISRASGKTLDRLMTDRLFQPLGMKSTLYNPPKTLLSRIAPTENDPWRNRLIRGEVHDENAFAMGGVAGHAGLFSSAHDLAIFAQMLLNGGIYDHRRYLNPETIRRFTAIQGQAEAARGFGWAKPSPSGWSGRVFSPAAFGHTGFTGTMIWIDPDRELFIVLLTNRVHPTRQNTQIDEARQAICESIMRAISPAASGAVPAIPEN
jgi:beta-N-acetylhexosaminidase